MLEEGKNCGFVTSSDLKNKLSEEEWDYLYNFIDEGESTLEYKQIKTSKAKQAGIIRKSAREILFETLECHKQVAVRNNRTDMVYVYEELEQLIDAALKEAAERANNNGLYNELIMAVQNKYPNETRHETALRLITDSQKSSNKTAAERAERIK